MAKQKIKNPGKPADVASKRIASDDHALLGVTPVKARGKRKARLRVDVGSFGKKRPVKGVRKAKKESRASPAPVADAAATELPGLSVTGRRPLMHKIGRSKVRLGPLERLELAIDEVRVGGRVSVRTRKLQISGIPKMAQKVIEEAGEVAIEAVLGNPTALVSESADLFYNLVVLLGASGVPVEAIWAEMDRRAATLGMAEKLPKVTDTEV